MDLEAPADGWYVWLGVSIASVAIAGIVMGLPTGPPPDANGAANAIDRTAGSPYEASTVHNTDADMVILDRKTIAMRNEHGTARASIAHGEMVLVTGDDRLENITYGTAFEDEFEYELDRGDEYAVERLIERIKHAHQRNTDQWRHARSELVVRSVMILEDHTTVRSDIHEQIDETDGLHINEQTGSVHATLVII